MRLAWRSAVWSAYVFVFLDPERFRNFVDTGLEIGGSADAMAAYQSKGSELGLGMEILPGVEVYQLSQSGLAASASDQVVYAALKRT